ncbi:MAG: hypothetical protein HY919_07405 [Elusimicrobia bacterium]|nr:hypothetical protein [Elusimicrobiota bacterium]
MKIWNVITRHAILIVNAETPDDALKKSHVNPDENAFVRECENIFEPSFIVNLVSYSVKRLGVLIDFNKLCRNILESETLLREKLKEYTSNTEFGSEHLLYGLVIMGDDSTREFFRKKGITEEKLLCGIGNFCFYKPEEQPKDLMLENFTETIYCCGVYLDARTLFLSILREGMNARKIIKFIGHNPKELIKEYADFCGISEYFLKSGEPVNRYDSENCLDGIDIYKYVKNQTIRVNRITRHLKECKGLCLKTAAFVKQIEAEKKKPELLW